MPLPAILLRQKKAAALNYSKPPLSHLSVSNRLAVRWLFSFAVVWQIDWAI